MSVNLKVALIAAALLVAKWGMEVYLALLNRRHVLAHADEVPAAFTGVIDKEAYTKSIRYTLAKIRFGLIQDSVDLVLTLVWLFSGILPWVFNKVVVNFGDSAVVMTGLLLSFFLVSALIALPLSWVEQFILEERFGFNTTTPKLWIIDHIKGGLIAIVLGGALLFLVLKIIRWCDSSWWLWAWGAVVFYQLLMMVLAPVVILPLFNRFTPLSDGALKDRLMKLAGRTQFKASAIQVMDGSKRSRHSNAFFIGFGRFRKIVLFDTLIQQLSEQEVEAVLAHEIGHYRMKHVPLMLLGAIAGSFITFYLLAYVAQQHWFYSAFGFHPGNIEPAILIFSLLFGAVTFWLGPLSRVVSRFFEYQADRFAADAMGESGSLVQALRKLNEKNLSNLVPHPFFSAFYYSHPTLVEREKALEKSKNPFHP